jgi:4-aminobutyrate aminotransferase-like enzyme/Ser/Thr protein kinase RdoA (MazF antagonist)
MPSLVQAAPHFTLADAERIAADLFGLEAAAAPLPSERDQNFQLSRRSSASRTGPDDSGKSFVLKIANSTESREFLGLQNEMIRFLSARHLNLQFPRVIPSTSGDAIALVRDGEGRRHFVRLLTWLEGVPLAEAKPHDRALLVSLGRALAEMDAALAEFDHPAAHRSFYWDLRSAAMAREHLALLPESRRRIVEPVFGEWAKLDWSVLRSSVIHNDANDYNVLVSGAGSPAARVTAVLDYGDVVYSATVCNLAVALAYAMLDKADPISAAAAVVAAYHEIHPLTEPEVDSLYTLVCTRLACSVCYAAFQAREAPGNDYLNISNAPAWALLEKLDGTPSDWPPRVFRYSCGLPVVKRTPSIASRKSEDLLSARKKHLGPSLSLSYRAPLHIVAGSRQYLYDAGCRRFLDCVNNVAHVGHSHPRVVRAATDQMAVLNTNTRYLHGLLAAYIERLVATLPAPLSVVFLTNSGSEANELALRLARAHTAREEVIVIEAAYHGNTSALIDISPYKFDGPGGRGRPAHVHKVRMPDTYRGAYRGPEAGKQYAAGVTRVAQDSRGLAAFFCESALSCAGQIILPPDFLREAYAAVRAAGGVCVADEVQTGLGRAGSHFWMFETQGVVPDIVTLGKPIGNGHPLGAVITSPEIARSFANGMEYFNTFGGNPVSCAAGLAVLDVIRDEDLQENARVVGDYLLEGLRGLQQTHPLIGDVRGQGLFIGVEMVRNRETLEPAAREAADLVERMKDRGVLLSTDGPLHNVIKIKPPLVFSRSDADLLVAALNAELPL